MIKATIFSFLFLIFSCNSTKKVTEQQVSSIEQLHDIWMLKAINDLEIDQEKFEGRKRIPILEIYLKEKRIGGNDSCNDLFGKIEMVNESAISFTGLGGTKMACPDMTIAYEYGKALVQTRSYKVEKLNLLLYDGKGKELLKFLKID